MYNQKIKYGFTLVELIVVITILAILGTIAFISLSGYSEDVRDSTRISDLSSIKTSLELFELDAGKYPIPTNGTNITYSGSVVWKQGTIGETVHANLSKLDKIPKDPLTEKEYTYSVISNGNEYELGGMVEGDMISMNNIVLQTNAGDVEANAYTTGNYNGLMSKSLSGITCSILSIPSIITNDTSVTDLQQIVTEQRLVYKGYKNLPSSLKTSKFNVNGGFAFSPNKLVSYSDTGSCSNITANTASGTEARVTLIKGLQDSYSGTLLKDDGEIKNIVKLVIDIQNPSAEVVNLVGNLVNNNLGGKILGLGSSSSSSGGGSPICEDIITQQQVDTLEGLWQNGNINMYGDINRVLWLDPLGGPLTKNLLCNEVYVLNINTAGGMNSDLVQAYNSMNNLARLRYNTPDFSADKTGLSTISHLYLGVYGGYDSSVYTMINLEGLYLEEFGLTSISPEIGNLINLKELSLYDNLLTSLPIELSYLTKLIILDLEFNTSLGDLSNYFGINSSNLTNSGITIGGNGTNVVIQLPPSVSCGGSIPSNATATTVTTYIDFGTPINWGVSQSECDFNCNSSYTWNGASCSITLPSAPITTINSGGTNLGEYSFDISKWATWNTFNINDVDGGSATNNPGQIDIGNNIINMGWTYYSYSNLKVGNSTDVLNRTGVTHLRLSIKGLLSNIGGNSNYIQVYLRDKNSRNIIEGNDSIFAELNTPGNFTNYTTDGTYYYGNLDIPLSTMVGDGNDGLYYIQIAQNFSYNTFKITNIAYVK